MFKLILLLLGLQFSSQIQFTFFLDPGTSQCFTEELPPNTLLYGSATCRNGGVAFSISQYNGDQEQLLDEVQEVREFEFHHVTEMDGKVQMCFESIVYTHHPVKIFFKYDSGGETHDFDHIARKGQIQLFNHTIHSMEALQRNITREQQSIVHREHFKNAKFTDVSSKIIGFGGVTFAALLITAACQIMYIKKYFTYKKLI